MRHPIATTCIALVLLAQAGSAMAAEAPECRTDEAHTVAVPEVGVATTPTTKGVQPWSIALRMTTDTERLVAPSSTVAEGQAQQSGGFVAAGALKEARVAHTATLLPDGRVLVVGGVDGWPPSDSAEVWERNEG